MGRARRARTHGHERVSPEGKTRRARTWAVPRHGEKTHVSRHDRALRPDGGTSERLLVDPLPRETRVGHGDRPLCGEAPVLTALRQHGIEEERVASDAV